MSSAPSHLAVSGAVDLPGTRGEQRRRTLARRMHRHTLAAPVVQRYGGLASQQLLLAAGLTREDIRAEVQAGRWKAWDRHTVAIGLVQPGWTARFWWALWESGRRAVLDGASALVASGLEHWELKVIDISLPNNASPRALEGVRHTRRRSIGPIREGGIPRTCPEVAVIRAAQAAGSDRQAATVIAMTVQQRLVPTQRVLDQWAQLRVSARRSLLDAVIRDVCDGAHSMGELDFGALCRARGVPLPSRQQVRIGPLGRVYLDIYFDRYGVHVEIQGAQHGWGLAGLEDALKANSVAMRGAISLQIPVLGLRLRPDAFVDQVEQALAEGHRRMSAS